MADNWEDAEFNFDLIPEKGQEKNINPFEDEEETVTPDVYIPPVVTTTEPEKFKKDEKGKSVYIAIEKKAKRIAIAHHLIDCNGDVIEKGSRIMRESEHGFVCIIERIRQHTKEHITFYTHNDIDVEDRIFKLMVKHFESYNIVKITRKLNIKTVNLANEVIEQDRKCSKGKMLQAKASRLNTANFMNSKKRK